MTSAAPWSNDTPAPVAAEVQALVLETLRQCGILLQPIMPGKATSLLDLLGVSPSERTLAHATFGSSALSGVSTSNVRLFDMSKL